MPPKETSTTVEIRKTLEVLSDKINNNHIEVIKELNANQLETMQRITTLETKINPMPVLCSLHSKEIKELTAEQNKTFGRRSIIQIITGSGFVLLVRELISFITNK
jgi:hypothetical protein